MWDDTRIHALQALGKAIPKKAANGELFLFKVFFCRDIFFHNTRKYLGDTGDNRRKSGQWIVYNTHEGGVQILCAMLGTKKLPVRVSGANIVELNTVTQLSYNLLRRLIRVRGVLKTDMVE